LEKRRSRLKWEWREVGKESSEGRRGGGAGWKMGMHKKIASKRNIFAMQQPHVIIFRNFFSGTTFPSQILCLHPYGSPVNLVLSASNTFTKF